MDDKLRKGIVLGVRDAGSLILNAASRRRRDNGVEKRAREMVVRSIRSADPQLSMWGEEGGRRTGRFFAVCAIDSTVNFRRGLGRVGVMAAVYEDNVPVMGAIRLPEADQIIVAEAGQGTRINGTRAYVSDLCDVSRAVVSCSFTGFTHDLEPLGGDMLEILARSVPCWRNLGSPALEYSMVAEGAIDGVVVAYAEAGHGAGFLAMKEAGASVTDRHGRPFSAESESVIAANPALHEALLEALGRKNKV